MSLCVSQFVPLSIAQNSLSFFHDSSPTTPHALFQKLLWQSAKDFWYPSTERPNVLIDLVSTWSVPFKSNAFLAPCFGVSSSDNDFGH